MTEIWKGQAAAAKIEADLTPRIAALKEKGIIPGLGIVRVGERPDDLAYERGAMKRAGKLGISVKQYLLPPDASEQQLIEVLRGINDDTEVHGCLLFKPLPKRMNERRVCETLAPEKDVDGITITSMAGVFAGRDEGYPPCTAQACIEILDAYGYDLTGKNVVVVGRSLVIGKPVSMLLIKRNATVTICHTKTVDMPAVCRRADLIVAAAGRARMLGREYLSAGQTILDVGINVLPDGSLCGDVNAEEAEGLAAALTPVPGGIGSVTTSVLAKHVVEAAEKAAK